MPLEFLTTPQGEAAAAAPEVQPEIVAEPAPQAEAPAPAPDGATQDRGPDGKFLPKAAAQPEPVTAAAAPAAPPVQAAEPQAPATPPAAEPAAAAPDRVAELERQVAGLTKALTATRQERRQPAEPAPDPQEDLEAYQRYQENQRVSERADWSRRLAEARTSPETVAAAQEWAASRFEADPIFAQRALTSSDPYGFALEEYEQHQTLQMLRDPTLREKFQAFMSGQAPVQAQPTPAPVTVATPAPLPAPSPPPPSLASSPSAGGPASTPAGPGQAFDRVFSSKG